MLLAYGTFIVCKAVFENTKNKLILTHEEKKPLYYEVTSIGKEVKFLVIGDKLQIKQHSYYEIKHKGEDFLVIDKDAILAIIYD